MKEIKYYCLNDEPNAKEVSEEDYARLKEKSTRHLTNFNSLKH
jgi:hypothetical protein